MVKLSEISGEEPCLVDAAMADMGVEVAIRAFGAAERPMHVDPKRRLRSADFNVREMHRGKLSPSPLWGRDREGGRSL
jgi:hypothetical protein